MPKVLPKVDNGIYQSNLELMGKQFSEVIQKFPEKPIEIDPHVAMGKLNNPLYTVLIGFSTDKIFDKLMQYKKKIENVLIIEPDMGIFHQTMKRVSLARFHSDTNIDLLIGIPPEQMIPYIAQIFSNREQGTHRVGKCANPQIIFDPFAYPQIDGKDNPVVTQITHAVKTAVHQVFLAMGCSSDTHYRWEQMYRNRHNLQNCLNITPLLDKFLDTPIIVCGAGPSLEGFIKAYHEYDLYNKSIIIAADACLKIFRDRGVKPHILTRCERKVTMIFSDITKKDTAGIYYAGYPWTPSEYFDLFDLKYMLFRGNGVCNWTGYKHANVNGGVSAANAALELALMFGSKNIVLTGVDLCFLNDRSHIEGTEVEFDIQKSKDKWTKIPGNSGEVTTIPVWFRCLNEYNMALIKHVHRQAKVFNTSINGAKINGTDVLPWEELKSLFKSDAYFIKTAEKFAEKHTPSYEETFKQKTEDAKKFLKEVVKDLEKLFLGVKDALTTASREELLMLAQLNACETPEGFWGNLEKIRKNLEQVYSEPARQIDEFKKKYYSNEQFAVMLLDMTQLELFQNENRTNSLENLVQEKHEQLKAYSVISKNYLVKVREYAKQLYDMFDKEIYYEPDISENCEILKKCETQKKL